MFSSIKNIFSNKNKEIELKEKELELKEKELKLKEKELDLKNINEEKKEVEIIKEENNTKPKKLGKKEFIPYTEEEKKAYAKKMKDLKEKGKEYEEFIANYFKLDGYEINLNGIKKGKKDKGIDIICNKEEELILIQCKNWKANTKFKIGHEKLKAFVGACTEYINENKLFEKNIKLKFITSNFILDKSGEKFLEESKTLKYEVIEFKKSDENF